MTNSVDAINAIGDAVARIQWKELISYLHILLPGVFLLVSIRNLDEIGGRGVCGSIYS